MSSVIPQVNIYRCSRNLARGCEFSTAKSKRPLPVRRACNNDSNESVLCCREFRALENNGLRTTGILAGADRKHSGRLNRVALIRRARGRVQGSRAAMVSRWGGFIDGRTWSIPERIRKSVRTRYWRYNRRVKGVAAGPAVTLRERVSPKQTNRRAANTGFRVSPRGQERGGRGTVRIELRLAGAFHGQGNSIECKPSRRAGRVWESGAGTRARGSSAEPPLTVSQESAPLRRFSL